MATITSGNTATGTLGVTDSVTISTRGAARFECPTGTRIAEFSGTRTFGPYDNLTYTITAVAGPLEYEVADGSLTAPITGTAAESAAFHSLVSVARILKYDALYRWFGAAAGASPNNQYNKSTGLSTAAWTSGCKMEVEAPFYGVRLMWVNRAANAINANKALVGVTETNATDTSNNRNAPVIGGTAYPVVAGGSTVNGFRAVTWAGAATKGIPAATTSQQIVVSDLIPLSSIPRADGGTRPLLIYRHYHDGAAQGNWAFPVTSALPRTPTAALRNRTIQVTAQTADTIATPGGTMNLDTTWMEVYPIVRHAVPVLSVWGGGDSITQQDGLVTDIISCWGMRACLTVSTPALPVVYANFGASGSNSADYLQTMRNALAAGAPAPSVLVIGANTINDLGGTPNARNAENMRNAALNVVQLARDYEIPVVIWWPLLPYDVLDAAGDAIRKSLNTEMRALALQLGITWIDNFSVFGDGATPERWVSTYRYEAAGSGLHPNETATENVMAPALANCLLAILGR